MSKNKKQKMDEQLYHINLKCANTWFYVQKDLDNKLQNYIKSRCDVLHKNLTLKIKQ